jgi:predicted transcriptional regulator
LKRKFVAARADLVEKISELAKKSGRTMFSILNEALDAFIKAKEKNKDLYTILEEMSVIEIARNAGMIFVPEAIYNIIMENNNIENYWKNSGQLFGKYLEINGFKELKNIEKAIKEIIGEDIDISISSNKIICICPRLMENRLRDIASFLEGVMVNFGFNIIKKEISKGIVIIRMKKGETIAREGREKTISG